MSNKWTWTGSFVKSLLLWTLLCASAKARSPPPLFAPTANIGDSSLLRVTYTLSFNVYLQEMFVFLIKKVFNAYLNLFKASITPAVKLVSEEN